jgi:hypothetical protein
MNIRRERDGHSRRTVTSRHADARACAGVTAHQVTLQIGQSISIVNV